MVTRNFSNQNRPFHLGNWPLEKLPRSQETADPDILNCDLDTSNDTDLNVMRSILNEYQSLFSTHLTGETAVAKAPIPDDPQARTNNLKSHCYFLDVDLVGCCCLKPDDWLASRNEIHRFAVIFLLELPRQPESGDPGDEWITGTASDYTDLRLTEVAAVVSGYLRWMGFEAKGHVLPQSDVNLARLAIRSGISRAEDGKLVAPFLKRGFRLGAVTTEMEISKDLPLSPNGPLVPKDPSIQEGRDGTKSGWYYEEESKRLLHLGQYPMENIKRVDQPTTLVLAEEITRVSKRGDFFKRAEAGDLGKKAQQERFRFPMKHPYALGMLPLIRGMVPLQGTRHPLKPTGIGGDLSNSLHNAQSIKALGYYLGADFVGICKAEPFMYYSHDEVDGQPIDPYHEYAVVMLIDQGFETMEGASGDDWISASQSMRGYLRGAEIAGIMAAYCRQMGFSSRSHSNAHSEIIHNPAIVMAGLGEVSRIGDTILNPFIGPRSKSVIFTTDFPMEIDRPIDFGLQDFCEQCRKCARECPCNAIPFGPKVMFNGYEIWKADVEKCTKYRVTQSKGSACGRCMKMCPWNREDTIDAQALRDLSINNPSARAAIIAQDDELGRGRRNPIKRWWFDLEVIDGVAVNPPSGTNERDLNLGKDIKMEKSQKLAMFPPALQPKGGTTIHTTIPIDRERGLRLYQEAEYPRDARLRTTTNSKDH